jgi:hypothetical protein
MELDSQTQHVFSVQGSFQKMQKLLEMELVVNGNAMLGLTTHYYLALVDINPSHVDKKSFNFFLILYKLIQIDSIV